MYEQCFWVSLGGGEHRTTATLRELLFSGRREDFVSTQPCFRICLLPALSVRPCVYLPAKPPLGKCTLLLPCVGAGIWVERKDLFQIYLHLGLCAGGGRSFGVRVLVLSPFGTFCEKRKGAVDG